jgi:hypothetical protein
VLTYLLGTALGSRAIGLVAVVLFSVIPQMTYWGSELLPTVFESSYVLGACYAALRAGKQPGRGWLHVSLSLTCAAYLAKETTVFFLPGLLVGLLLMRKNFRECAAYAAAFAVFVALETLFYALLFGLAHGRLSIIRRHHLGNARLNEPIDSLRELLAPLLGMPQTLRGLFVIAVLVAVTYPWWRRRDQPGNDVAGGSTADGSTADGSGANGSTAQVSSAAPLSGAAPRCSLGRLQHHAFLLVALTCFGYFFFTTFAFKSWSPLLRAQPANTRYLGCALPFLALIVAAFLVVVAREPLGRLRRSHGYALAAFGMTLLGGLSLGERGRPWANSPLLLTPRYEATLRDAFDAGIPIAARNDGNALTAVSSVFLDRKRAGGLRCVGLKGGRNVKVCVNGKAERFRTLSKKELRSRLAKWNKAPHVEVSTKGGFSALVLGSS